MGKSPHNKGQLLIEVMIAIFLVTAAVLGYFGLMIKSLSLNTVVANNYTAVYLASEGIEVVKNLIDNNYASGNPWNQGINSSSLGYQINYNSLNLQNFDSQSYLKPDDNGFYVNEPGVISQSQAFQRKIDIENTSADEIKIISTVTWNSKGKAYSVSLHNRFYNWR